MNRFSGRSFSSFPGAFIALPAMLALTACGGIGSQANPGGVPVEIALVEEAPVRDSTVYLATISSDEFATISPRVSGNLSSISVRLGDPVSAGQVLMQLDDSVVRAELASAQAQVTAAQQAIARQEAALHRAESERMSVEADLDLRQAELERREMLMVEGAIAAEELDTARRNSVTAQATLASQDEAIAEATAAIAEQQAALEQARASAAATQAQLDFYTITAPFSGTVGNIPVKVGDLVEPGTALTTLNQNETVEVEIRIPLERASGLRPGLTVELLGDGNEQIGTSEIASIERNVDEGTQSILAKAAYSNVENGLLNTQFVRARVVWDENPGLLVPTSSISRIGGQTFVYVAAPPVDPDTNEVGDGLIAAQTPVQLGDIQGQSYHVVSGLESGDRIVTSGILKLQNNVPIVELPQEGVAESAES